MVERCDYPVRFKLIISHRFLPAFLRLSVAVHQAKKYTNEIFGINSKNKYDAIEITAGSIVLKNGGSSVQRQPQALRRR